MAFQRQLQAALVLLCTGVFLRGAAQPTLMITVARQDIDTGQGNTITLRCLNDDDNPTVEYRYSPPSLPGGSRPVSVTLNGDASRSVSFELTPQTEGEYFCRVNGPGLNEIISNSRNLVAFPEPIPNLAVMTAIQRGAKLALNCDFEVGLLSGQYTFRWSRIRSGGVVERLSDGTQILDPIRFQVLQSPQNGRTLNSFEIMEVEFDDESAAYFCNVTITDPDSLSNPVTEGGRSIQVDIYDTVHVEMEASPQVVLEGDTARFQCVFEGDPAPTVTWRLNGAEILNGGDLGRFLVSSTSLQERSITSTVTIIATEAQDNGVVECEATNANSLGTHFTAASITTLTVLPLPRNIDDLFLTTTTSRQNPIVFLHFMLPARFVAPVRLTARFTDVEDSDQFSPTVSYDNVFGNTTEVNFRIPDLPSFDNFTTQINFVSEEITSAPIIAESVAVQRGGSDDGFLFSTNFIVAVAVGAAVGAAVIVAVVGVLVVGVVCYKRSREEELGAGGPPTPGTRVGHDYEEPLEKEKEEELPWQALFSVKDGPWQASWHLYTMKLVMYTRQTEINIDVELGIITVEVDVPWQATLQEPLPWQATESLLWEAGDPTEAESKLTFTYTYCHVEETLVHPYRETEDYPYVDTISDVVDGPRQEQQEKETFIITSDYTYKITEL